MRPTLYVALSSHGYGHIGQTAPVVNELHRRIAGLRVVLECGAPRELLARRFDMLFEHVPVASDFGMVMKNALEVDAAASHARYLETHARIETQVEQSRRRLVDHRATVLLTNVPYVPLIAARGLGLPAVAMCSLNWAAIYRGLCGGMPGAERIHDDMLEAYRSADAFIALEPSMDMPGLANVRAVGPVAATGDSVRDLLLAKLRLGEGARLVTVSMGGIATALPLDRWPRADGVTWIMPDGNGTRRSDMVEHSALGQFFVNIMRSSDALITKPGYGAFAEAGCSGVPVLYVPRVDWPEAPFLVRWLAQRGACVEIGYDDLFTERLAERLDALWKRPRPMPVAPTGIAEAADILESLLAPAMGRPAEQASQ